MIKEAIKFITDNAVEASGPKTMELADGRILNGGFNCVNQPASVSPLEFETLTGLIDYIRENGDVEAFGLLVVVDGPGLVQLKSDLMPSWNMRQTYVKSAFAGCKFRFDRYVEHEPFIIGVQSWFVDTGDRQTVLDMAAHLEQSEVFTASDDGAGQTVSMKRGMKAGKYEKVPNPVVLAPYRTFPEIEQPASPFIFRVKPASGGEGPYCMLVEADGGAWRMEAVSRVKAWLTAKIKEAGLAIPVLG